jgi:hypothetical protein
MRVYEIIFRFYQIFIRNYEIFIRFYELLIHFYEILIRNYEILIRCHEILLMVIVSLTNNLLTSQSKGVIYKSGSTLPPNVTIIMVLKIL